MAIVVEDGTGLVNANAYISAAAARQYWLDQAVVLTPLDSAAPGVLSLETCIIAATRYIELRFRSRFKGTIQFPPVVGGFAGQALSFPRLCLYDVNGYPLSGVPVRMAQACAEYMRRAIAADLLPDPTQAGNLTANLTKVGPIETSQSFTPGSVQVLKPYPTADGLIAEFITTGTYAIR